MNKSLVTKVTVVVICYLVSVFGYFIAADSALQHESTFWVAFVTIFLGLYLLSIDYRKANLNTIKLSMLDFAFAGIAALIPAVYASEGTLVFFVKYIGISCFFAFVAKGKLIAVIMHMSNKRNT